MSAKILNGELIAQELRQNVAKTIIQRSQQGYKVPALAVVLIGEDYASKIYVRNKKIACQKVGITTVNYDLPASTTQDELLKIISNLNHDSNIDGILVQLPLPKQINSAAILDQISQYKDVDGFHPYNLGRLAQNNPFLRPCTPAGIMLLLEHTKQNLVGKNAVVIGASNIVGLPMALELINAGTTVTVCQKTTIDLAQEVAKADILVAATGNPELIKGAWIKPGAIVIDVGMNHTKEADLIGDVEFKAAQERASWITPVPGGVGPMTIASLLNNTLAANINPQKTE